MEQELADRIHDARFTATKFRSGYHVEDVDAYLDRLVRTLRDGGDVAALLHESSFPATRLREGYDMVEVDGLLDETRAALGLPASHASAGDGTASGTSPVPGAPPVGVVGAAPRTSLLGWLFDRR